MVMMTFQDFYTNDVFALAKNGNDDISRLLIKCIHLLWLRMVMMTFQDFYTNDVFALAKNGNDDISRLLYK